MSQPFAAIVVFAAVVGLIPLFEPISPTASAAQPRISQLTPYLLTGRIGRARHALRSGKAQEAATYFKRYLATGRGRYRKQARFLYAYALLQAKNYRSSARQFRRLIREYPLLEGYHAYYRTLALFRNEEFSQAIRQGKTLIRKKQNQPLVAETNILIAKSWWRMNAYQRSALLWKEYLKSHPNGPYASQASFFIARAMEIKADDVSTPAEQASLRKAALERFKQITIADPLDPIARDARRHLDALAANLPDGQEASELTASDYITLGHAYFSRKRNEVAERAFRSALQKDAKTRTFQPLLRCRAHYYLAKSVFNQRERYRAIPLFEAATAACRDANQHALASKSLYNQARSMAIVGRFTDAAKIFAQLDQDFPASSLADDARIKAAEMLVDVGQPEKAKAMLAGTIERFPNGDMVGEAGWRLAFAAYQEKRYDAALDHLSHTRSEAGGSGYYSRGRACYWTARSLEKSKRLRKAFATYTSCIEQHPFSYYALLGLLQIKVKNQRLYRKTVRRTFPHLRRQDSRVLKQHRRLVRHPSVARGIELARLGFGQFALQEFSSARFNSRRISESDQTWFMAFLLHHADQWNQANALARRYLNELRSSYPVQDNYWRWIVTYPDAFETYVLRYAKRNRLPEALVWAVMRQESRFSPRIESWANAIGLMQLILPTARRMARHYRTRATRSKLQDPEFNIKLGTKYLSLLTKNFKGATPLVIASYNAGEAAVERWAKEFGDRPLDEFVELIPYDETRRYTKRVLASFFAYSALYGKNPLPRIPLTVPQP